MKEYSKTNWSNKKNIIDRCMKLNAVMLAIEIDFATFSVNETYDDLLRIFINPTKELTITQSDRLKHELEYAFGFGNQHLPEKVSKYDKQNYVWHLDIREDTGSLLLKRTLKDYWEGSDIDLMFLIEKAPKKNCKIVKKERTIIVYEEECENE